jgi:hypothetical protein
MILPLSRLNNAPSSAVPKIGFRPIFQVITNSKTTMTFLSNSTARAPIHDARTRSRALVYHHVEYVPKC